MLASRSTETSADQDHHQQRQHDESRRQQIRIGRSNFCWACAMALHVICVVFSWNATQAVFVAAEMDDCFLAVRGHTLNCAVTSTISLVLAFLAGCSSYSEGPESTPGRPRRRCCYLCCRLCCCCCFFQKETRWWFFTALQSIGLLGMPAALLAAAFERSMGAPDPPEDSMCYSTDQIFVLRLVYVTMLISVVGILVLAVSARSHRLYYRTRVYTATGVLDEDDFDTTPPLSSFKSDPISELSPDSSASTAAAEMGANRSIELGVASRGYEDVPRVSDATAAAVADAIATSQGPSKRKKKTHGRTEQGSAKKTVRFTIGDEDDDDDDDEEDRKMEESKSKDKDKDKDAEKKK